MLVHRWAILRRPMPRNMPFQNETELTDSSCKLHNHCIDENDLAHYEQTKIDNFYSSITGSIPLVNDSDGNMTPVEMIDGGDHSDDYNQ